MSNRDWVPSKTDRGIYAPRVAIASTGTFVGLLLLLHLLKSDLDPSWHFISEYEIGTLGWIMQVAFFALALGNFALFLSVRKYMKGILGGIASVLFLVGTIGTVMVGIFPPDPINTAADAVTRSGNLHNLGGGLGLAGFLGTLIYSAKLLRNDSWRSARRAVWLATAIIVLGFLISFISIATIASQHGGVFGPDTPIGWPNRLGILSGCAWLMIVSWQAMSLKHLSPENSRGI